jgi:hypothetical protein
MIKSLSRALAILLVGAASIGAPSQAAEPVKGTIYIRCDDGGAGSHHPVAFALNEANNTVSVTEYRMTVSAVNAISFGPKKVLFNVINDRGVKTEFTISRTDLSVSSRSFFKGPPRMRSLDKWGDPFQYSGCGIVKPPVERAF